jgi:ribosomal protein S17E
MYSSLLNVIIFASSQLIFLSVAVLHPTPNRIKGPGANPFNLKIYKDITRNNDCLYLYSFGGMILGRVRQKYIKRTALKIVREHEDELTVDFKKNRTYIDGVIIVQGKVLRNRISGYVTSLVKQNKRKIKGIK